MSIASDVDLVASWNATATPYPRDSDVCGLFREVARAYPNAPAILFGNSIISYDQLDRWSTNISLQLLNDQLRLGEPVGVALDRSPTLVATLIGILKAGGCYVPFDRGQPKERLRSLVHEVEIERIIGDEAGAAPFREFVPKIVTQLPGPANIALKEHPYRKIAATDPAYILFTSGTTGAPKGVVVPHRAVNRLVRATNYLDFERSDTFLFHTATSFDPSTFEIWAPLLNGATLAIAKPGSLTLDDLASEIDRYHVRMLFLTTGLFHQMVDHRIDSLSSLRCVLAGGDVMSPDHARRLLDRGVVVVNGYGPTEHTTFVTAHVMHGPEDASETPLPIGKPLSNDQVYILSDFDRQVAIGEPGEICTGGDGIALGYRNRPDLTSDRFFMHTLESGERVRLYKTGDLGYWRPDGRIAFLGRKDRQVKIRGFRVEPAEIEEAIRRHPLVQEALVVAHDLGLGHKQLVAYVVAQSSISKTEIETVLAERLPSYLVPSHFVFLNRLPLKANGKVDLESLPQPWLDEDIPPQETETPTRSQETMLLIWRKVFRNPQLGLDFDFFDHGGDSLLATALLAEVQLEFPRAWSMTNLFQHRTPRAIEYLACHGERIEDSASKSARGNAIVTIAPGSTTTPVFFIPCIQSNLFTIQALAQRVSTPHPFVAILPRGADGKERPDESISEIVSFYLRRIRLEQPSGPYRLMGYSFGGVVAFELARRLRSLGESVKFLALIDAPRTARPWWIRLRRILTSKTSRLRRYVRPKVENRKPRPITKRMEIAHSKALVAYQAKPLEQVAWVLEAAHRPGLRGWLDRILDIWNWREVVAEGSHFQSIPGAHETIFAPDHIDALAEVIQQMLDENDG